MLKTCWVVAATNLNIQLRHLTTLVWLAVCCSQHGVNMVLAMIIGMLSLPMKVGVYTYDTPPSILLMVLWLLTTAWVFWEGSWWPCVSWNAEYLGSHKYSSFARPLEVLKGMCCQEGAGLRYWGNNIFIPVTGHYHSNSSCPLCHTLPLTTHFTTYCV